MALCESREPSTDQRTSEDHENGTDADSQISIVVIPSNALARSSRVGHAGRLEGLGRGGVGGMTAEWQSKESKRSTNLTVNLRSRWCEMQPWLRRQ